MLQAFSRCSHREVYDDFVLLEYESRQRSRLRITTARGRDIALQLPRGTVLAHGDQLRVNDGTILRILAACEQLSRVESGNTAQLARAAFHLGNRHVALEVGDGYVAYQHDHVLDEMLRGLGFSVISVLLPFSPEPGAYQHHEWGRPLIECTGEGRETQAAR
jgi:urease accessory protein